MGRQADDSGIDKQIIELVKLRVSQFNNCAFCLQIHLNVARKLGVPQEKLDLVATWEEAGIFPEQERAGAYLGGLVGRSVSNEAYQAVRQHFSKEEVAFLSVSIATIDA
jgi:AhpD family alkylhydroperoxidase